MDKPEKDRLIKAVAQFRKRFPEWVAAEIQKQFFNAGIKIEKMLINSERFSVVALVNDIVYELLLEQTFTDYLHSLRASLQLGVRESQARENSHRHIREAVNNFLVDLLKSEDIRRKEQASDK